MNDDLFNYKPPAKYPDVPGFKEPTTSKDAAEQITGRANILRARTLAAITNSPDGLTADEVAEQLQESVLAVRPRVSELRKAGKIVRTGRRRVNASGMKANVWIDLARKPQQ